MSSDTPLKIYCFKDRAKRSYRFLVKSNNVIRFVFRIKEPKPGYINYGFGPLDGKTRPRLHSEEEHPLQEEVRTYKYDAAQPVNKAVLYGSLFSTGHSHLTSPPDPNTKEKEHWGGSVMQEVQNSPNEWQQLNIVAPTAFDRYPIYKNEPAPDRHFQIDPSEFGLTWCYFETWILGKPMGQEARLAVSSGMKVSLERALKILMVRFSSYTLLIAFHASPGGPVPQRTIFVRPGSNGMAHISYLE